MFVISWAQWDTGVTIQQPLVIPKLFRKNNSHKNPGLCCSRLPVQGQQYLSFFFLLFFFLILSHSQFFFFLSSPLTASLPSTNPVNSFSSYQDGIGWKKKKKEPLFRLKSLRVFLQIYLAASLCTVTQWGEMEHGVTHAERGGGEERQNEEEPGSVKFLLL